MATFLDMLGERAKVIFIRPENKATRDAKAETRLTAREEQLEQAEQAAETTGDTQKIDKIMIAIKKIGEQRAYKLFDQLVQVRLLATRQLRLLSYIEQEIKDDLRSDQKLDDDQRRKIGEMTTAQLKEAENIISSVLNSIFESETSIASLNISLKQLQNQEAKNRELIFNYMKAKRAAKVVGRDEKRIGRKAKHQKNVESPIMVKQLKALDEHLSTQMRYLIKATGYTLQLLKDDEHDLQSKEHHLQQLMADAGYPKTLGEALIKEYDKALLNINTMMQQELAKERIAQSDAIHLKAA